MTFITETLSTLRKTNTCYAFFVWMTRKMIGLSGSASVLTIMRERQRSKFREIGAALVTSGVCTLDDKAKVLGLLRSTVWTLLRADYKSSGLSAGVINRMLRAPQLPVLVRAKILEYIEEKSEGLYGHNKLQLRRFTRGLSVKRRSVVRIKPVGQLSAANE